MKPMQKINNYLYYILIAIVSFIGIGVMPLIGSEVDLAISFPNTVGGWFVYVITNLINATGNMLIFFGFMSQAKINVQDNENFKRANEILLDLAIRKKHKEKVPKSPKQWQTNEYSKKGIMLFLGSIFSCIGLANAILTFNVIIFVSYVITTIFAIIFGIFQMKHAEAYWVGEFYQYALYEQKRLQESDELENSKGPVQEVEKTND